MWNLYSLDNLELRRQQALITINSPRCEISTTLNNFEDYSLDPTSSKITLKAKNYFAALKLALLEHFDYEEKYITKLSNSILITKEEKKTLLFIKTRKKEINSYKVSKDILKLYLRSTVTLDQITRLRIKTITENQKTFLSFIETQDLFL